MNHQKEKQKFRASKEWQSFRKEKFNESSKDYITHSKLRKGWNLHHASLDAEKYDDLSNPSLFFNLNHNTHQWVHQIFTYYKKDPEVLDRLKEVLDLMKEIN